MKLTEILGSNDIDLVLVDTSIEDSRDFTWGIYESTNYSHLNARLLKKEIELVNQLKKVLENPKTRTINAITRELRSFENIINSKIKYFSSHNLPRKKKTRTKIQRRNIEPQNQLALLQNELYSARRLSYSKELKIEDNNYKLLFNMVKLIESIIKIKKDMGFVLGFRDENRARASDTDERLTAALYWLSLFSDKSSCLITKDRDFIGLSGIITGLIGSDSFLPYNEFFRKRIIENPFSIYTKINEDFKLTIDNAFTSYDNKFLIRGSYDSVNESIKDSVARMWREFNPSREYTYQLALPLNIHKK